MLLFQYPARVHHIPPRGSGNTLVGFPGYHWGVYGVLSALARAAASLLASCRYAPP
jgi:hypothetical protein